MIVTTKLNPKSILYALGFEEAPDRGMQIVLKPPLPNSKYTGRDYRNQIPQARIHALFFENQINIHTDIPIKKTTKHRSLRADKHTLAIVKKLQDIENWYLTLYP